MPLYYINVSPWRGVTHHTVAIVEGDAKADACLAQLTQAVKKESYKFYKEPVGNEPLMRQAIARLVMKLSDDVAEINRRILTLCLRLDATETADSYFTDKELANIVADPMGQKKRP